MSETVITPHTVAAVEALGDDPNTLPPRRAFKACELLGPLACWWLPPVVRERARRYDSTILSMWTDPARPNLPTVLGACVVLCVWREAVRLLAPAYPLPLRWRRGPHSGHLPAALRAVADDVRTQVGPELKKLRTHFNADDWGLDWAEPMASADPVRWEAGEGTHFESGWVSLAAGLIAASQGLPPAPGVWASGAWGPGGLQDVGVLAVKLDLTHEWGVGELFVPVWRAAEMRRTAEVNGWAVAVGTLAAPPTPDVLGSLGGFLARTTGVPERPDPNSTEEQEQFAHCRAYFLLQPDAAVGFYRSHLLDAVIRRVRRRMPSGWYDRRPARFVTLASFNPEVAVLTAQVIGAERTLLLFTEQTRSQAATATAEIPGAELATDSLPTGADMADDIRRRVAEFAAGVPADRVVIDIKPGTKRMTYDLSRAARPGNWLFCLETTFLAGKASDPGTERPELWLVV